MKKAIEKLICYYQKKIVECDAALNELRIKKNIARTANDRTALSDITSTYKVISATRQVYIQIFADIKSVLGE